VTFFKDDNRNTLSAFVGVSAGENGRHFRQSDCCRYWQEDLRRRGKKLYIQIL
jgi:hypothetical protein